MHAVRYRLWWGYVELGTHILGPQLEQLNAENSQPLVNSPH